ncbi:NADPH-dependent F420 reductase [Streptomyces marincola]|uniref:NADPH-dependent F420 reductase n=1 Tax=Streptomyces marincola TaxID=2878388 RepID=UPI001CF2E94E|nr:NAD(P)-binding domain-containing protein [Streptomyces marincola]UCM88893.1 NAD(P)-binding domain-containing protein [Streptomyces marincola]
MRIGCVGAGQVGGTLARFFTGLGHEVLVANSRDPRTLSGLVADIGGATRAGTAAQAAAFGDVVVVSVPWGRYRELPADALGGKVVIDTCNYLPRRDGHDPDLDDGTTTSSEKIQSFTQSRLIKTFNVSFAANLRDRARPPGDPDRLALPVSGDDAEAKALVCGLVHAVGFDPVDAGGLAAGGRRHEPGRRVCVTELPAGELTTLLRTGA